MSKIAESPDSAATLQVFTESDDDSAFRLFARLCRASPALREWLWEEFARKPKTRVKVAAALAKDATDADAAAFTSDNRPLRIEAAALREQMPARIYGGLTWSEVVVATLRRFEVDCRALSSKAAFSAAASSRVLKFFRMRTPLIRPSTRHEVVPFRFGNWPMANAD